MLVASVIPIQCLLALQVPRRSDCSGCTPNDDVTNLAYQHRSKSLDDSCLPASYLSFKYPILSHNNNAPCISPNGVYRLQHTFLFFIILGMV